MSEETTGERRRILIVDDNPAIHEDFRKILSRRRDSSLNELKFKLFGEERDSKKVCEYEVANALQGQEALGLVQQAVEEANPFALAFIDMRMPPGWNGIETIKRLWEVDQNLQVVICSAYSDELWTDVCKELGLRDNLLILKKPFDDVEVLQLAQALTEKHRLTKMFDFQLQNLGGIVDQQTVDLLQVRAESDRLLDAISLVVLSLDSEKRIWRWNRTAENVFGKPASEVIGKQLSEINVEWRTDFDEEISNCQDEPEQGSCTIEFVDSLEQQRILEFSTFPVQRNDDSAALLLLGTDLTEKKWLTQQLQQSQKMESVGQLAAGVAHEINTPLQYVGDNIEYLGIKFATIEALVQSLPEVLEMTTKTAESCHTLSRVDEMLSKLGTDDFITEIDESLADARKGIQHVAGIVKALKEFSHPGSETTDTIDINHAIQSTIAVSTNEWKYVAQIQTDLQDGLPTISGFAGELNQVFLNLVINAAHAIAENGASEMNKGKISIKTECDGDDVIVLISDTGAGIPKEIQDRIFDPFYTTKEIGKGTGQGLAIAHAVVVQKHGGRISFSSEPGTGTEFRVVLPKTVRKPAKNQSAEMLA